MTNVFLLHSLDDDDFTILFDYSFFSHRDGADNFEESISEQMNKEMQAFTITVDPNDLLSPTSESKYLNLLLSKKICLSFSLISEVSQKTWMISKHFLTSSPLTSLQLVYVKHGLLMKIIHYICWIGTHTLGIIERVKLEVV